MPEPTVHAREPVGRSGAAGPDRAGRRAALLAPAYRYRWPLGALGVLAAATALILWARTRPGYDPYGWLVWGHLTLHGKLDTNGAPSWKPLPYMFTLPYSLIGRHALWLWMITSVAVSLSGLVFAYRVAFRLVRAPAPRRLAAHAAGLVAAAAVLGITDVPHSILSAESDTMIVALCLAAIDCGLQRRFRWAFWVWWLAALGRPEAWAPLALYALWAWFRVPGMRLQIGLGVLAIPLLWLGIPALTSKSPFSAASLAENSPRAVHGNKLTGTLDRYLDLNATGVEITALLAVAVAAARRDRAVLLIAGFSIVWAVVEVAFALHGWSAVPRYQYEAGAAVAVLSGVFVGRVIVGSAALLERLQVGASTQLAGVASLAVVALFAVSVAPTARSRIAQERADLTLQRTRTKEIDLLGDVVRKLGRGRILACGQPNVQIGWQSVLAWYLGTNTGELYFSVRHLQEHPHSVVKLYPHSYGWELVPRDQDDAHVVPCRGLKLKLTG